MTINASKSKNVGGRKPIEPVAPGTYPARLVSVVDIGLQEQYEYQGQKKDPAYMILVTFELTDEFLKDENGNDDPTKPRWVSDSFGLYNLSNDKAKSTKYYIALDPKMQFGGDWGKLIGTPCMVTITHNPGKGKNAGRVFEKIAAIAAMRPKDAEKVAPLVNKPVVFEIDSADVETFKSLPEWVQKRIASSLEFDGSKLAIALGGEPTEEDEGSDELDGQDNPF